jgi:methionyl-tRNA formyltransferase
MRVIFAGTPRFAVPALEAIAAAGHTIDLVLTRPDRPAGRGLAVGASPVAEAAKRLGLVTFQPATLRDPPSQERLRSIAPDVMVVVAYGLILPQAVLDIPGRGAINIHASLLPRWRGAAPIHRAIEAGDTCTGISIMQMDAGLDTGPLLLTCPHPISPEATTGSLHDALSQLGAEAIVRVLQELASATMPPVPQAKEGVTYAAKITKAEGRLDWAQSAVELERRIRALDPAPGAHARFEGVDLKIWKACVVPAAQHSLGSPGLVVKADSAGIDVTCGTGVLRLQVVQRAGGKRMQVADLLRGQSIKPGNRFALTPSP